MVLERATFTSSEQLRVKFNNISDEETLEWSVGSQFITIACREKCPFKITQFIGNDSSGWTVKVTPL